MMLVPLAVNVTSWGGAVGAGIGLVLLAVADRRRRARRAREERTTVGWVLGWRMRDGSLHSRTAPADLDELDVDRLAGRKSLEAGVVETWVSWRTPEGTARRYYANGGRL
ncbi:hypothetical protein [Streptosporangium sp. NPDC023615]|uniref:hypothetical protein n=1 Tax=Streptosporangium sp. NPDC023615 TaxID=3154794 RepID=UPI00341DA52C